MSKCRSMYAGSSGSVYNANAMHPGNGNGKWQGLVSTTNMRSSIIPYVRTRADSNNRNVVFCMNQLGGVGRKSTMFASTADGVKLPCQGQGSNANIFKVLNPGGNVNFSPIISSTNQLWIGSSVTAQSNPNLLNEIRSMYKILIDNIGGLDRIVNTLPGKAALIPIFTIPGNYDPADLSVSFSGVPTNQNEQVIYMFYAGTESTVRSSNDWQVDQNGFLSPSDGVPYDYNNTSSVPSVFFDSLPNSTQMSIDIGIIYSPSLQLNLP